MARKTGLWLGLFFALASLPLATGQDAQGEPGERIMNDSCTSCHGPRPIDVQALDHDGWTNMVDSMVEKGSHVKSEDAPILIDYLVRRHGPLPDGAGKPIVLNICTQCHDLLRVRRQRTTAGGWEDTLEAMLNEGAPLSDQDFSVVLRYLSRNFGPEQ